MDIEYFIGSRMGEKVKELLEEADIVVTPTIVMLEIANKYAREGFSEEEIYRRIGIIQELSRIDPIRKEILLLLGKAQSKLNENARKLGLKRKPSMVDYYLYAVAEYLNAKIVTGDKHFKGLKNVILPQ